MFVANALLTVSGTLSQARYMLQTLSAGDDSGALNGSLCRLAVLLQAVLDGVASASNKLVGGRVKRGACFQTYRFVDSEIRWVEQVQRKVMELRYMGDTFDDVANRAKHEELWVGAVGRRHSEDDRRMGRGYDGTLGVYDTDGVCFIYGMLIPVYNHAVAMVSRLCKQYDQPVPAYPEL